MSAKPLAVHNIVNTHIKFNRAYHTKSIFENDWWLVFFRNLLVPVIKVRKQIWLKMNLT